MIEDAVKAQQYYLGLQEKHIASIKQLLVLFVQRYTPNRTDIKPSNVNEPLPILAETPVISHTDSILLKNPLPTFQLNTDVSSIANICIELKAKPITHPVAREESSKTTVSRQRSTKLSRKKVLAFDKAWDIQAYALQLLNAAIPYTITINPAEKQKALNLLELSLDATKVTRELPRDIEETIQALIQKAVYRKSVVEFIAPANWARLFYCETYGIHFNEQTHPELALTAFTIMQVLSSFQFPQYSYHDPR